MLSSSSGNRTVARVGGLDRLRHRHEFVVPRNGVFPCSGLGDNDDFDALVLFDQCNILAFLVEQKVATANRQYRVNLRRSLLERFLLDQAHDRQRHGLDTPDRPVTITARADQRCCFTQ